MSDIIIRDMRGGDVEVLVEIALAAWAPIYGHYREMMGEELFLLRHPDWQAEKADQIRRGCGPELDGGVGVVEAEGRVVGFVTYYPKARTRVGEIGNNAVHPDYQGKGIGTRMYAYAFERLRQAGMQYVEVGTGGDPSHAPARRAYQKAGFDIVVPGVTYFRRL